MPVPKIPLSFPELEARPQFSPQPRISDDIQQVLSLITGYDGSQRKLLKCSPAGVLYLASPSVKGIVNILANVPAYNWQGEGIPTSEVLILNNPKNTGDVWVNVGGVAAVDVGYPLETGDWVLWGINNLRSLHLHIVDDTEKAIVVYTI